MAVLGQRELIRLPKIEDDRGSLSFIEGTHHIPFEIRRVFYLYGIPGGAERGGHAHKLLHQFIVAVSGSFDIVLDDGVVEKRFHLDRPDLGVHVVPMIWAAIENFSPGSVCMVVASDLYDEADYYRDYSDFRSALASQK
ncbi:sugar 3,4-ketoisomerase [Candidatus Laterigemmans baculatus]|uniref:sugar 3,4-ketoisomerase n=1 Tax=Candidatus Laterigemmans baculatus TaxID=2770505 RepID=UPI0013DD7F23|nr:FdtA/QdtA family cupin domain-containing protein [Candidatus Laterigemmans baculatus]